MFDKLVNNLSDLKSSTNMEVSALATEAYDTLTDSSFRQLMKSESFEAKEQKLQSAEAKI